jgi:HTH-type transcriptional regulator / antitoxin HigA
MSTLIANPAEMIAHGAPHVIHNDAELEAYTEALFQLTSLENLSGSEVEAIELLTLLVERYEQERYPITEADPVSVVRLLLERQNLAQRDLITEFGSESAVSMFLSGERNLTLEQIRKLGDRFNFPLMSSYPKRLPPTNKRHWLSDAHVLDKHPTVHLPESVGRIRRSDVEPCNEREVGLSANGVPDARNGDDIHRPQNLAYGR